MIVQVLENKVYYYTGGKPFHAELPTAIFIHGAQNDHSVWSLQSRYLAHHGYNVVALDLPGHGRSGGCALTSVEAMAQWVIAFLDVAGIAKASLIGHSMGSLIALETARAAPDRITKLVLLGNAYPMKVADALLTMARENEPAAIDMVTSWSHYSATQKTPNPGFNLQGNAKRLMQRMSSINSEHLFYTDFAACNSYLHGEDAAKVINNHHCPTLFVMAKQDRMTPTKASVKLRSAIPEAKVIEIEQCGHSLMTEQPDAVLGALVEFLK